MADFDRVDVVGIPDDDVIDWVKRNLEPEFVFPKDELERWALENGFVKDK